MLGSAQDAEDVVQDVLLKLWEGKWETKGIQNLEAWGMRMVKNKSLDALKLKANQPHEDVEESARRSHFPHPDQHLETRDSLEHIGRIIDLLPLNQKMCIQLREIEGESYEEIAEILEMPMNQVKVNIFRARKRIRAEFVKLENKGTQQPQHERT